MNLARCAELMNSLPWVRWDRCVILDDTMAAYGWIERPDSHEDFVVLQFEMQEGVVAVGYTTSSAQHSEEIGRLLYGAAQAHYPCQRIEHVFPAGAVGRVVHT